MKNTLLITIALFVSLFSFGQNEMRDDTTKIKIGKITVIIESDTVLTEDEFEDGEDHDADKDDNEDGGGMSFDIGMNGYLSAGNTMSLPNSMQMMELDYSKSRTFGFTFYHKGLETANKKLYIKPGIGFSWNNYFFKNNISISTGDSTIFSPDSVTNYKKYKFRTSYVQIPILAGVRLGDVNKKPMGLQLGVIGGYNLNNIVKQKILSDKTAFKNSIKDDYNVMPFKLEFVGRISIGEFGIFGKYNFTSLFEANKAPIVYPFAVGFTFGGF